MPSSKEADLNYHLTKSDSSLSPSGDSTKSLTLTELLSQKLLLEEELDTSAGTDEEALVAWEENYIELKDKIDAYGYLIHDLQSKLDSTSKLQHVVAKNQARINKLTRRIKGRLNQLSNGKPLRGTLFSFLPYTSKTRTVALEKLSEDEIYVTLELKLGDWHRILNRLEEAQYANGELDEMARDLYGVREIKRRGKVSELPIEHPAIVTQEEPSVRIT